MNKWIKLLIVLLMIPWIGVLLIGIWQFLEWFGMKLIEWGIYL